mgnify:CR=1 FL=1
MVFGRKLRSESLGETLLPKRIALPIFASDALSSNAYATQEIMLVLAMGGAALTHISVYMAAAVVLVFTIVVLSYRQNVHAYPSGGGDYEVVTVNLGPKPGLVVASALLVDYILTVAVSVSSAVANPPVIDTVPLTSVALSGSATASSVATRIGLPVEMLRLAAASANRASCRSW